MTYSKTGPFVNASAPGISATFLNNVENTLTAINSAATDSHVTSDGTGLVTLPGLNVNATAVTINGATAGSITLYQPMRGPVFKVVIMRLTGFRNNGGHTQGIVLPSAFTGRSKVWFGDLPSTGVSFQKSGVTVGVATVTAMSATGGTVSNVNTLFGRGFGEILGAWDTMIIPTGGSAVTDGVILVVGW